MTALTRPTGEGLAAALGFPPGYSLRPTACRDSGEEPPPQLGNLMVPFVSRWTNSSPQQASSPTLSPYVSRSASHPLHLPKESAMTPDRLSEIRALAASSTVDRQIAAALLELAEEVHRLQGRVDELEDNSRVLRALEAAGVDNWDGYEDACRLSID
ncbi:hypothetical protein GCM10009759_62680 [Kitasatospora saccharophila]|uniref:Uncharacterized protein n=2 Tax=Kitasatospora saccharophila TaxID=407973 RepID=A0ABP5JKS5_9ACTN